MSSSELLAGKRILVTGGAGFIGSNLVERLLALNCRVIVLDNLSSGRIDNLPLHSRQLSFVKGDIRNQELARKLARKSDMVFHLAEFIPNTEQSGPGHVIRFSTSKPIADLDVSVRGTLNILESASQAHIKVVFASTAAVYGEPLESPIEETMLTNPISPYGASKLAAEIYCRVFNRTYDLPVVIARLFNVYGPRQRKYLMHDILLKLRKNPNKLEILGSGNQQRDFIYVSDAVEGLILLATEEKSCGDTFNLGTGIPTSVRRVVTSMAKIAGVKPEIEYTGHSWKGDIEILVADIAKMRKIGFRPRTCLLKGIKEFTKWFQQVEQQQTCA